MSNSNNAISQLESFAHIKVVGVSGGGCNAVDRMIKEGLLQEVEGLLDMGYGPELNPMQSLGYKQKVIFIFIPGRRSGLTSGSP